MKLYPYNLASESAKLISKALNIKRIKHYGKRIKPDCVLNWGASTFNREIITDNILNKPDSVKKASNKLESFKTLQGHTSIPEWTEELVEANKWLAEGFTIVARTVLNGHSGQGIILYNKGDEIKKAPLYVKYIPKKEEYRLHVFRDKVFFIQRKARNKEVENVNWKIRNHKNGFIFANQNVDVKEEAKEAAITSVKLLGLDFGAVDIIYNEAKDMYYVLECNTAPGLSGTTLDKYVEVFRQFV